MSVLVTWSPEDALFGAVAPLGLAAAAGTALVIDFDPAGIPLPGSRTLADLVAAGPRRSDLAPQKRGIAVMPNGGIDAQDAAEVVDALAAGWPALVIRAAAAGPDGLLPGRVVPCRQLVPIDRSVPPGPAVYQRGPWRRDPPGPGLVLPRPRPGTVRALLEAVVPAADRWIRAWRPVWRLPWP